MALILDGTNGLTYTGSTASNVSLSIPQNVGIGTASPLASLDVTSATLANNFRFSGNNFAGGNFYGTSVNTSGVFLGLDSAGGFVINVRDAGYQAFSTSNTERVRINSSGYVGIANIAPASLLHVGVLNGTGSLNGYTKFTVEGTDYAVATWKSPAANFSQIIFTDTTTTNLGGINYYNSSNATPNAMAFLTNATERVRIDSSGNVGIGFSSTDAQARISITNSGAQNVAHFKNYSGTRASPTENADWPWPVLALTAYGNYFEQKMLSFTLPNDANSQGGGIYHTDSSVWNISLNGVTGVNSWDNVSGSTVPANTSSSEVGLQFLGPGNMRLGTVNAKNIYFRTNGTDKVTIDSSGNVGIGVTPSYKLDVSGAVNIGSTGYLRLTSSTGGGTATDYWIGHGGISGQGGGTSSLAFYAPATQALEFGIANAAYVSMDTRGLVLFNASSGVYNSSGRVVLKQSGSVIQTVSTTLTTFGTTTSTTYVAVSGLSVAITPSNTSSQVLVRGYLYVTGSAQNGQFVALYRNGAILTGIIGAAGLNAIQNGVTGTVRASGGHIPPTAGVTYVNIPLYFEYLDSPASTSAQTYQVYIRVGNGSTMYYNYQSQTGTNADFGYYASTITAQEIAA